MKNLILLGAALALIAPAAHAASDAGNRKPTPAHGYAVSHKIEAFKAKEERIYNNAGNRIVEDSRSVDGTAYGDQVNEIPAKEKYYNSPKGYIPANYHGASKSDCR